jgi:hypothetical protein
VRAGDNWRVIVLPQLRPQLCVRFPASALGALRENDRAEIESDDYNQPAVPGKSQNGGFALVTIARPIRIEVPGEQADDWLRYLQAECQRRGWATSSSGRQHAQENRGSITINTGGADTRQLSVVWERRRHKQMRVRASSVGQPEMELGNIEEFFQRVNERRRTNAKESFYRGGPLEYEGPPWGGELWLDDTLRLGPPSQEDELSPLGPRVVLVDTVLKATDGFDATELFFTNTLKEISAFLSVVTGWAFQVPRQGRRAWTWTAKDGRIGDVCVRQIGYIELEGRSTMPERGVDRPVPLKSVIRPDLSTRVTDLSAKEVTLPADVVSLWAAYLELRSERRRQFLQAAAKWQEALMLGERSTLSYALMVVACEALKPDRKELRNRNVYDVVEGLLGKTVANQLRNVGPQTVRNAHLHHGEIDESEMICTTKVLSYYDLTFTFARLTLRPIVQEAIIKWLTLCGEFTPASGRPITFWRWVKLYALKLMPIFFGFGVVLGWFLRRWSGY